MFFGWLGRDREAPGQIVSSYHSFSPRFRDGAVSPKGASRGLAPFGFEIDGGKVADDDPDLSGAPPLPRGDPVLEAHQVETDDASDPKREKEFFYGRGPSVRLHESPSSFLQFPQERRFLSTVVRTSAELK